VPAPILVVDDDPGLLVVLVRALEMHGFPTVSAALPAEALAYQGPLRLLVTDIQMPGLDGFRLATLLRKRHAGLPVLLISGSHGVHDGTIELPGPTAFLDKPFVVAELVQTVRRLLVA
jgi:CheY-like chemotaxis protein